MVTHTTVDREELLRAIIHKMHRLDSVRGEGGRPDRGGSSTVRQLADMSRIELINEFSSFVNGEFMAFRPPPLLLIDEAQNLAPDVLEEIRLLTNLEGPKSKLVQVILSGQPELESLLGRNDLRQLHQRIAVRAALQPLSCAETEEYVVFRLNQAGADGREIFTPDAVQAIWAASGGVPRTINVLCDYALVNALGTGADQVTWALVDEAIQDVLSVGQEIPEPAMSVGDRWDDEATSPSGSGSFHWAEEPLATKPKPYVLAQPCRAENEPPNRDVAAGGEDQEPRGE
jgi:general secretion pathway protein A